MPTPTTPYAANIAGAIMFALAVTLLALAWFDMLGYQHFIASWLNL